MSDVVVGCLKKPIASTLLTPKCFLSIRPSIWALYNEFCCFGIWLTFYWKEYPIIYYVHNGSLQYKISFVFNIIHGPL